MECTAIESSLKNNIQKVALAGPRPDFVADPLKLQCGRGISAKVFSLAFLSSDLVVREFEIVSFEFTVHVLHVTG